MPNSRAHELRGSETSQDRSHRAARPSGYRHEMIKTRVVQKDELRGNPRNELQEVEIDPSL